MPGLEEICGTCGHPYGNHFGSKCPYPVPYVGANWSFPKQTLEKICGLCGHMYGKHRDNGPDMQPLCPDRSSRQFREAFAPVHPEPGDRVLVDIYISGKNNLHRQREAIFIKKGLVFFLEKYDSDGASCSSWSLHGDHISRQIKEKNPGIDWSAPHFWQIAIYQSKIMEVLTDEGKEKEKMAFINCAALLTGDRVIVQCRDRNGFNHEVEATVLHYDPSYMDTHVFLDQAIPKDLSQTIGNSGAAPSTVDQNECKSLGLDWKAPQYYKVGDGGVNSGNQYTKITKLLQFANDKQGKDSNMSVDKDNKTSPSFGEMFKTDLEKSAWRTGATQVANGVQSGLLLLLKEKGGMDDNKLAVIKELFATQIGNALIRSALGYGLTYAPGLKEDARVKRLSEEFRVSGMNVAQEEVFGALFQYLAPAFEVALQSLPPVQEALPAEIRKAVKPRRKRVAHDANKSRVADSKHEEAAMEEEAEAEAQAAQA